MTFACLPMYDWAEVRDQTAAFWANLRRETLIRVPNANLPATLAAPDWAGVQALWRSPALVFSQTCWGPLSLGLIERLVPLAQPDYSDVEGGRGPYYRAAIIARDGEVVAPPDPAPNPPPDPAPDTPRPALPPDLMAGRVFAYNSTDSLSGYIGLARDLGLDPPDAARACVATGGHRASIRAVAAGQADLAAIDCRSWALALRHEPCAARLRVVGWTAERLGLPFVTSRATDTQTAQALRATLITMGCHDAPEGRDG